MASVGGVALECTACCLLVGDAKSLHPLIGTLALVTLKEIGAFKRVFSHQISPHILILLLIPDDVTNIQWRRLNLGNIARIFLSVRSLVRILLFRGLAILTKDGGLLGVEVELMLHHISDVV
jgi:hypothetical protein